MTRSSEYSDTSRRADLEPPSRRVPSMDEARAGTEVRSRRQLQVWIAGLILIADQTTKMIVRERFDLYESVTVIPGFFDLTRVHNTGAAFGLLNAAEFPFKTAILTVVALAALAFLAMYAWTLRPDQRLTRVGLSFVIGGAAGNLIDRVTAGYVLDFFDFYWRGWHFWAFNVADAAITVGVTLMIADLIPIPGRAVDPGDRGHGDRGETESHGGAEPRSTHGGRE